jgi:hypothetical protein
MADFVRVRQTVASGANHAPLIEQVCPRATG